jgi:Predicted membrane protein (DUF2079)
METSLSCSLLGIGILLIALSQSSRGLMGLLSSVNPNFRAWIARIFSVPSPDRRARRGEIWLALAGAVGVGAWLLTFKLRTFYGLGTTSDLYDFTQMATSWLKGRFMDENCYGNILSNHTFLICPVLAVLAWPLGAVGLLVVLCLAAAAGFAGSFKLLRLFDVPTAPSLLFAGLSAAMPLTLHTYADVVYGFHPELLVPAMALWLAYFALTRNWPGTLAMALVIVIVKEEYPIVVAVVGVMVCCEDLLRTVVGKGTARGALNRPALVAVLCALAALPLLLLIIKLSPHSGYSPGNFDRLKPVDGSHIKGAASLTGYLYDNLGSWLNGASLAGWLGLAVPATFGLIWLRPQYLLLGFGLTLISWLMQDDPLWAPRFAGSLAFFQLVQVFSFGSVWAVMHHFAQRGIFGRVLASALGALVVIGVVAGFRGQLRLAPDSAQVYALRPVLKYSEQDRAMADELFGAYRREARADEPVIASPYLFRYAHDRNLFWFDRLAHRPEPVWILWDGPYPADPLKYRLEGRNGRFHLYRRIR